MTSEDRTLVFVSHVSEDRAVASWLRTRLQEDFLNMVGVFVSSDSEGIGAGDAWFETINMRLAECSLLLTLCTPESVYQPWINFEAGWAWALEKPVVPVCHGGLMPEDLKMPFSSRQAVTLTRRDDLESLYNAVADARGSDRPRVAFDEIARDVPEASPPDHASTSLDRLRLDQERVIRRRIRSALEDDQRWRTPLRVANAAGVSEEVALMILRADDDVRFGSSRDGKLLVGLKRRVDA